MGVLIQMVMEFQIKMIHAQRLLVQQSLMVVQILMVTVLLTQMINVQMLLV